MSNQYEDIMSVADVAEALFIGKNRTYELLNTGALKGFRIGRVWKIPRAALQEYILAQSNLSQAWPQQRS